MKQFYQIHELAKLFNLCPDTLRYYEEKGLLHPVRGENRYRMYGIQDVCTLNIIRALRELKIPTRAIRTYLERRSVGETLSLLDREEALLRRRMAELEAAPPGQAGAVPRRGGRTGLLPPGGGAALRVPGGGHHPGKRDRLPAEKAGAPPPGLSQNHRQPVYGGGGG